MQRLTLERQQVWVYLAAIALGLLLGSAWPSAGPWLKTLLWPTLVLLLYATFVQVPLLHLRDAFRDRRFVAAVVLGNFVLLPLLAWVLVLLMGLFQPANPVLVVGVLLVLLVPCTDWFISFSQLGGGNVARAIAVTPLLLLLQLLLLPPWLWLIAGGERLPVLAPADLAPALLVLAVPLVMAALTERWIEARPERAAERDAVRERLAWWPVPLLALVVFQIAAAQVGAVLGTASAWAVVVPVFVLFLLAAAGLARLLARLFVLPTDQGRTLAFSFGTRNSFVVLPLALSLPAGWELAAVVIVVQSLVELLGMVLFLWWVPRRLFPVASGRG